MDQNNGVNLINRRGDLVSLPQEQVQDALGSGYQQATPDQVDQYFQTQEFGTTGQQVLTGLERGAELGTFGTSDLAENALSKLGVSELSPERRIARQKENPVSGFLGQALMLPLSPAQGVMNAAGEGAVGALGLGAAGAGIASKIGSTAVKFAVDGALIQGSDEVSKMLSDQTAPGELLETAIPNILLSGLIGGGIGTIGGGAKQAWQAIKGPELEGVLGLIKDKQNGVDGIPTQIIESAKNAGINLNDITRAGLSENTYPKEEFQTLLQNPTQAGKEVQAAAEDFKDQIRNKIPEFTGKTADEIHDFSKNEGGKELGEQIKQSIQNKFQPILDLYDKVEQGFSDDNLSDHYLYDEKAGEAYPASSFAKNVEAKIGNLITEERWNENPNRPSNKFAQEAMNNTKNWQTLEGVRAAISENNKIPFTDPAQYAARKVNDILSDAIEERIGNTLEQKNPELFDQWKQANAQWGEAKQDLSALSDKLGLGNKVQGVGPKIFLQKLEEKLTNESLLKKLTDPKDAEFFGQTLQKFPEVLQKIKDFHLNQLMDNSVYRGGQGFEIDPTKFFNKLNNTSPELKNFLFEPFKQKQFDDLQNLWKSLPGPKNNSWTAPVRTKLTKNIPGTVVGMIAALTGHNPILAGALGMITNTVGTEIPAAARLSLLKFLGSSGEVSSSGFKNMVDTVASAIKGENLLSKATKAIFDSSAEILPSKLIPNDDSRKKLDNMLQTYQSQPERLLHLSDDGSVYLPRHNQERGQLAMRAVGMLNNMRPGNTKLSPLDLEIEPNVVQKQAYNRALDFADQPLTALQHVREGTITSDDRNLFTSLYPNLYNRVVNKITTHMIDHVSKDNPIPYKTQLGLSTFMGQPMTSSVSPQGFMQIQSAFINPTSNQQSIPGSKQSKQKGSLKNIKDLSTLEGTNSQNKALTKWD